MWRGGEYRTELSRQLRGHNWMLPVRYTLDPFNVLVLVTKVRKHTHPLRSHLGDAVCPSVLAHGGLI